MAQTLEQWLEGKYGATDPATVTEITGAHKGVAGDIAMLAKYAQVKVVDFRGCANITGSLRALLCQCFFAHHVRIFRNVPAHVQLAPIP